MKTKQEIALNFTHDHSDSLVMHLEPVIIQRLHAFLRHEPAPGKPIQFSSMHDNYVVWIALEGCGCLMVDGTSYILQENNAMIVFPGQRHMRVSLEGERVTWLLIRFAGITPKWFNMFLDKVMNMSGRSLSCLDDFSRSFLEASNNHVANAGMGCSYHFCLLLDSLRSEMVLSEDVSKLSVNGSDYVRQACQLILSPEFIGKSYRLIARKIGISPEHLCGLFKKQIGTTPAEVMKAHKYHMIKHMLVNSTLNITQVAEQCGFDSVYSFSRYFKKENGLSPMQYRKKFGFIRN